MIFSYQPKVLSGPVPIVYRMLSVLALVVFVWNPKRLDTDGEDKVPGPLDLKVREAFMCAYHVWLYRKDFQLYSHLCVHGQCVRR